MNKSTLKQWELDNNSKVELPDGSISTFLKMDGMYAHWDNGVIGNFNEFVLSDKKGVKYEVKS